MGSLREFQQRNGPIPIMLAVLGLVVWGAGGETVGAVMVLVGVAWSLLRWKDARARRAHQSRDALTE